MLTAFLCSLAMGAMLTVAGLPLGLALRRTHEGWAALAYDSLVSGLVGTTLVVLAGAWDGPVAVVALLVVYAAVICFGVFARRSTTGRLLPAFTRPRGWSLCVAALVVVAVGIRLRYVNVIPWTGDMGGYVNWANMFARGGAFESGFPPLFTIWQALAAWLFGTAHTGATTPLLGALLIFGVLRICGQLRVHPAVRVLVGGVLALQVHAIWFSAFPASESLHAPLMLALVSLLISALRTKRWSNQVPVLAATVAVSAALSLNRAQTILLVAPLLLLVLCSFNRSWARYAWFLSCGVAATLLGIYVGYIYGVRKIPVYYVQNQLSGQMPKGVFRRLSKLHLFETSPMLFIVMAAGVLIVLLIGWLAARRRPSASRVSWPWPIIVLTAALELAIVLVGRHAEVRFALSRFGWWLPITATLVALVPRALKGVRGIIATFAMTTAVLFLGLHLKRFRSQRSHDVYLYWDRYLFSEFMPLVVITLALGLSTVLAYVRLRSTPRNAALAAFVALAGSAAAVCAYIPVDRTTVRYTMFDGAYNFEQQLDALASPGGYPVWWSASSGAAFPGFFPNSYNSLALPLSMSFGLPLQNVYGRSAFQRDPVLGTEDLNEALTCANPSIYVIDVIKPHSQRLNQRARAADFTLRLQGTVSDTIPLIAQPQRGWAKLTLAADVWKVTSTRTC